MFLPTQRRQRRGRPHSRACPCPAQTRLVLARWQFRVHARRKRPWSSVPRSQGAGEEREVKVAAAGPRSLPQHGAHTCGSTFRLPGRKEGGLLQTAAQEFGICKRLYGNRTSETKDPSALKYKGLCRVPLTVANARAFLRSLLFVGAVCASHPARAGQTLATRRPRLD